MKKLPEAGVASLGIFGCLVPGTRRKTRRRRFDNREFWDNRYTADPARGSGIGSRGELARGKRMLVERAWARVDKGSVLDVGFGDLHVLDLAIFSSYTGVDISEIAVRNARERYPEHTFLNLDFGADSEPDVAGADLTLCFDVLIHQNDPNSYRRMVRRLVARTGMLGLISGFSGPPPRESASAITFFHEPLSLTLQDAGAANVVKVMEYRGLDVVQFSPHHSRS